MYFNILEPQIKQELIKGLLNEGPFNNKEINYKISPFTFLFENDDFFCLFNSVNLKKLYGGESLKNLYQDFKTKNLLTQNEAEKIINDKEVFQGLIEKEFIHPENFEELLPLNKLKNCSRLKKPFVSILYILLTNACNLKCKYCTIEGVHKKPDNFQFKHICFEDAKKAIDLFAKVLDKGVVNPTVIFYGGEPMLNWPVLYKCLKYIRKLEEKNAFQGQKINLNMVTNGTLINRRNIKIMKKYNLVPSVSIDGNEAVNNLMRIYRAKEKGSFKEAVRGYNLVKEFFGSASISCTLGFHNLHELKEIAEFFALDLEVRGLGINLYKGLPPDCPIEIDGEIATIELIEAYKIFRKLGIFEDRIMRKIKAFINEKPWLFDCGGYGGQIAVNVDGYLGPCQIMADNNTELIGNVNDPDIYEKTLNGEIMRKWCERTPINIKECLPCEALGICGGGCVDEIIAKGGQFNDLDIQFCKHTKTILKWMIKDLGEKLYSLEEKNYERP